MVSVTMDGHGRRRPARRRMTMPRNGRRGGRCARSRAQRAHSKRITPRRRPGTRRVLVAPLRGPGRHHWTPTMAVGRRPRARPRRLRRPVVPAQWRRTRSDRRRAVLVFLPPVAGAVSWAISSRMASGALPSTSLCVNKHARRFPAVFEALDVGAATRSCHSAVLRSTPTSTAHRPRRLESSRSSLHVVGAPGSVPSRPPGAPPRTRTTARLVAVSSPSRISRSLSAELDGDQVLGTMAWMTRLLLPRSRVARVSLEAVMMSPSDSASAPASGLVDATRPGPSASSSRRLA